MSNITIVETSDEFAIDLRRRPPDLRRLRGFLAVAETRHFGRAAELLAMAQPPLSQQIAKLEAEIGAPLFFRSKRGTERVTLTDAGQALLPAARRLLADAEAAIEAARAAGRGERGMLRIAFVASLAATCLPSLLRAYRDECPDVQLVLHEMTTTPMLEALTRGEIDVGFGREVAFSPELSVVPHWREPVVAILPGGHPLAGSGRLDLATLALEPFILPPRAAGPAFVDKLVSLCTTAGFSPRIAQEATEWSTIIALVVAGMGVTLAPASAAGRSAAASVPLTAADAYTSVSVCWRPRSSEVRQRFTDWFLPNSNRARPSEAL